MDVNMQTFVLVVVMISMASMGLELTLADFRRIAAAPRATLLGLVGQLVLLPLLGLTVGSAIPLAPELAAGLVVITACPGGASSNMFSFLAGANLALSISMTALSSLASIVTIPLWLAVGFWLLLDEATRVSVPPQRVFGQLLVAVIVPIAVGMTIRARLPELSARVRRHLRPALTVSMVVMVVGIGYSEWELVAAQLGSATSLAFSLVVIALSMGWFWARAVGLDRHDAFTVSIEVGLQNGALATLVVMNMLQRPEFIIFPGGYVLISFLPVALWTGLFRYRHAQRPAP